MNAVILYLFFGFFFRQFEVHIPKSPNNGSSKSWRASKWKEKDIRGFPGLCTHDLSAALSSSQYNGNSNFFFRITSVRLFLRQSLNCSWAKPRVASVAICKIKLSVPIISTWDGSLEDGSACAEASLGAHFFSASSQYQNDHEASTNACTIGSRTTSEE